MKGTPQGPVSGMKTIQALALDEEIEKAQRREELEQRVANRMSKVYKMLSANYYITDWTHPCLVYKAGFQLSISEYFPELKIAVDKFYSASLYREDESKFKKEALQKHGIKYGVLYPGRKLADLYVELGMEG